MLIRDEMGRRFGDRATIAYVDLTEPAAREPYATALAQIEAQGLLYPVTLVDGQPVYDGAVSYPAVLRSVDAALAATA